MTNEMTVDTKNVKGNRKVVMVTLYTPHLIYKIPDGLDLEDKTVVKSWGYKRDMWGNGVIYIDYVDGREENLDCWREDTDERNIAENIEIEDDDYDAYYSCDESD